MENIQEVLDWEAQTDFARNRTLWGIGLNNKYCWLLGVGQEWTKVSSRWNQGSCQMFWQEEDVLFITKFFRDYFHY